MKKILVVDDDPSGTEVVVQFLSMNKYDVAVAENGRMGMEKALEFRPDLVILDVMMPDMHGFDVCEAIRADEKLKDARIIISTGKRFAVDRRIAEKLGADMFLQKPYTVAQMMKAVVALIGRPEEPLPAAPPKAGPG